MTCQNLLFFRKCIHLSVFLIFCVIFSYIPQLLSVRFLVLFYLNLGEIVTQVVELNQLPQLQFFGKSEKNIPAPRNLTSVINCGDHTSQTDI